jgi:double-strand break repair protein AddB
MFAPDGPRLLGLPPGVDFPHALVQGLKSRLADAPPEAMGRVTLYLNTTRMMRRVRDILAEDGARILPRLRLVTDLGAEVIVPGLAVPVPALRRQLQLTVLISRLLTAEPGLAPRAAIADLAESLAALMGEMQGEGVSPDSLAQLDVADFSEHWQRTRAFLAIIAPLFGDISEPDAEGHQRLLVEYLARRWAAAPPADPVIVAGSTGSRGTTALLMQAVARLPQGAVVLPGVDFDMPATVWDRLDDALTSEDHPQFRFRKLADAMGIHPGQIARWSDARPPAPRRNAVLSLALRPAPVTDQWLTEGQHLPDLPDAMADVTLIEAADPRTEAMAVALILRDAAGNGRRAALISPDRVLTRQVAAALARWGIIPDDSAGVPLNQSAPGRFLRHIARMFCQRLTADQLLVLLKHPLTASSMNRGEHLLLTRELELRLRDKGPAFPTGSDLLEWAGVQKHPMATGWAASIAGAVDGLEGGGRMPLAAHVARLRLVAELLARGPAAEGSGGLWDQAAGREAAAFLADLAAEAAHGSDSMTAAEFRDLFDGLISARQVRDAPVVHPLISIWGTIEARVQGADLVILGGLNDGIWPALPAQDPWLNRKMRHQAGLLLPERRIGLAAHDFQQAIAAPRVVISRALRNAEAETVPSRWLNRLTYLLAGLPARQGPEALAGMRARGAEWLARAGAMDRPREGLDPGLSPARRPAPCPPVAARPDALSLTRIETLIRDPYAIYADKILRLRPLKPLRQAPDARDRGTVVHHVLERFVRERPAGETPAEARRRLMALTAAELAEQVPWPAARIQWKARMERAADHFLAVDQRAGEATVVLEEQGELILPGLGFRLYGTPDRIDVLPDGRLHLIDYKTGTAPTAKQIESFSKQLHLAALLAEEGAFGALGPAEVARITYVGLGGDGGETVAEITPAVQEATRKGLDRLLRPYQGRGQGYTSRRAVFTEHFGGDYDHLARFGEWEMTDLPLHEPVGEKDAP